MFSEDQPSLFHSLRGFVGLEVKITGPDRDLHSGTFGGTVANPVFVLTELLSKVIDSRGKVTIPGFYDDVYELSETERSKIAEIPFKIEEYKRSIGVKTLFGEEGYTPIERTGIRPTFEINGIWGGYSGLGLKAIIPTEAGAKLICRLVPYQNPEKIAQSLKDYFITEAPPTVSVKVTNRTYAPAYINPAESAGNRAAIKAIEECYGKSPFLIRGGGSISIVTSFKTELGLNSVLLGFALQSSCEHSPNEFLPVNQFLKGIETICLFYKYFAENTLD